MRPALLALLFAACVSQAELIRRQDVQSAMELAQKDLNEGKPRYAADHWRRAWLTARSVDPQYSHSEEIERGARRTFQVLLDESSRDRERNDPDAAKVLVASASSLASTFSFSDPRLVELEAWADRPQASQGPLAESSPRPVHRPSPVSPDPHRFALVMGIAGYQRKLPPSTGAEADAAEFARVIEEQLGVPRRNIVLQLGSDATRSSIEAYLDEWLPRQLTPDSTLFVFFAGHGAPDPQSGEGYLVPWDADPKFIRSQGISVTSLLARVNALKAKRRFVFLDACFSGTGPRSVLAQGTRPLVALRAVQTPRGVSVFSAAAADETTGLSPDGAHGLFSAHLLDGLAGRADADGDGHVTVRELGVFLETHVADDAARDNRTQRPVMVTDEPEFPLR